MGQVEIDAKAALDYWSERARTLGFGMSCQRGDEPRHQQTLLMDLLRPKLAEVDVGLDFGSGYGRFVRYLCGYSVA